MRNQIEVSSATCLNTWKAEHRRKILFSLEEKEIGRAQNEKSKEYFSVVWRACRAVAGLASLLGVLLKKCSNINQKTPVIPFSALNPSTQMSMVRCGDKAGVTGVTNLEASEIKDIVSTPSEPYYIFDVEDGSVMSDLSVCKATELVQIQNRFPLVAFEVVGLGIHQQVNAFFRRSKAGGGSRSKDGSSYSPCLSFFGNRPELGWCVVNSSGGWGLPSCGSRS